MAYVPLEGLLDKTGSIYKLVILASKRTTELNQGSPKLVNKEAGKLSTVALEEIREGRVSLKPRKT